MFYEKGEEITSEDKENFYVRDGSSYVPSTSSWLWW